MKRIDLLKKKKCFSIFCGTALLFFLFTLTPQTVEAETVTESTSLVFTYSSGVGGNDFSPPFTSISADGTLIAYSSQVSSVSVLDTQEDEGVDMQLMKKVLQAQSKQDDATPLVIPDTYPLLVARPAAMVITPENTVYLTFDDGPSPYTTKILNELKKRGIKATFFVIGDQVKMYPDLAKRIVDEGHAIGIHTNTHKYEEVYASMDAFLEDYEECYKRIKEITDYPVTVTRFPGGSTMTYVKKMNGQFQAELAKRGFTYFDWNVSSGDAAPKNVTSDFIMTNIMNDLPGKNNAVILLHDGFGHEVTADTVGTLLDELIKRGYQFDVLSNQIKPVQFSLRIYTNYFIRVDSIKIIAVFNLKCPIKIPLNYIF